jgi:hypothetical protein
MRRKRTLQSMARFPTAAFRVACGESRQRALSYQIAAVRQKAASKRGRLPGLRPLKWSGKFGQRAKMYPTLMNGYENDEATEFFRQV